MKKLLFIILLLPLFSAAQTIGYLRYDSVKMAKPGGNTELILENATRAVTGGVLTNTGNGRTAFVAPAAYGDSLAWKITGNSGTVAGTNFIGTTDAVDFVVKTNGDEVARFSGDGNYKTSFGYLTTASGNTSTAMGYGSIASGGQSTAMGYSTIASGSESTAMGRETKASGTFSTAMNWQTKSKSYSGTVVGQFNDSTDAVSSTSYDVLNRAFQVGIGTAGLGANAMTVLFNGKTGIGTTTPDSILHVVGGLKFPNLYSSANATDSMMVVNSTGGVGYRAIPTSSGGTVTGTGTTNTGTKFTAAGVIGNASFTDNGTAIATASSVSINDNKLIFNPTSAQQFLNVNRPIAYSGGMKYVQQIQNVSNGDGTYNSPVVTGFNPYGEEDNTQGGIYYSLEPDYRPSSVKYKEAHLEVFHPFNSETARLYSSTFVQRDSMGNSTNQWDFRGNVFRFASLKDENTFYMTNNRTTNAWSAQFNAGNSISGILFQGTGSDATTLIDAIGSSPFLAFRNWTNIAFADNGGGTKLNYTGSTNELGNLRATSATFITPILGTPQSGTLTNCTLPVGGLTGLGTGVATFLATPSSANLATALTDETGTGVAVFGTSPTFTTQITSPIIRGSSSASGTLTLSSTSNATKANIILGSASAYDELNDRLGIGNTAPATKFQVNVNGSTGALFRGDNTSYTNAATNIYGGGTAIAGANTVFQVSQWGSTAGGAVFVGTSSGGSTPGMVTYGISNAAPSSQPSLLFTAAKSDGSTGVTPIGASELLWQLENASTGGPGGGTKIITALGGGNVGIGTTSPTAKLNIAAGTATASTAPLKFTSGTNLTTPEAGAVEYDGTNLYFTPASTRHIVANTLKGSATLDFGSTAATAVADLTITVTGAADGDAVVLGVPNGSVTATATYTAWVSAADTVTVRFSPKATEDPASGTFKVSVIK